MWKRPNFKRILRTELQNVPIQAIALRPASRVGIMSDYYEFSFVKGQNRYIFVDVLNAFEVIEVFWGLVDEHGSNFLIF